MKMLVIEFQSVMNEHKMSFRNSGMIKSQHCCTGKGARPNGFETHEKYYGHFVEKEMRVLENDRVNIFKGFSIQTVENGP